MLLKVFAFAALMLAPVQASAAWHEAKSQHLLFYRAYVAKGVQATKMRSMVSLMLSPWRLRTIS